MELYNHILTALDQIQEGISNQQLKEAWAEEFGSLLRDAKENSRVLVMGEFNAGKSTFLNALLEKEWLATDVTPATAMITVLKYGESPSLEMVKKDGSRLPLNFELLHGISAEGDSKAAKLRAEADHLIVSLPSELLKTITLVDTPGLNSTHAQHTQATQTFLQQADDVIWLFRYGAVGRMSEIQSFEQMKEYGIVPLGVVNAIDLHYDQTDEDLDELLQREQRKLRGYTREIIGVSSIDELEGILENDAEKREWSNFSALAPFLKQMEQLKLQRLLRELIRFFERFLEELKEQAGNHRTAERSGRLTLFIQQTVYAHINHQQKLHKNLLELQQASQAFNILNPAVDAFEDFIQVLQQVDIQIKKDFIQLSNKFQSIKTFHEKNIEQFDRERDEIIAQHASAVGKGIGRVKQLFTSKKKLQSVEKGLASLEKKRGYCEGSCQLINNYQSEFGSELSSLMNQLEVQINAKKNRLQVESVQLIKEYNERIDRVKSAYDSDSMILGLYAFIIPLAGQLEHIRSMIIAVENSHSEYILNRCSESLKKVIEGLQSYTFRDLIEAYTASVGQLEIDEASIKVEDKLPYELSSRAPTTFEGVNYTPYAPERLTLNTAYLRPYLMSLILCGALYASIWPNRDVMMSWVDKLKPAEKTIEVQDAVTEDPVEPENKEIGIATIVAYELNVRNEPDLNSEKVGIVKKGSSYKVLEERNGWLLIGENEWISGKETYVSLIRHP